MLLYFITNVPNSVMGTTQMVKACVCVRGVTQWIFCYLPGFFHVTTFLGIFPPINLQNSGFSMYVCILDKQSGKQCES